LGKITSWARDAHSRDRDETETRRRASRDRLETEMSRPRVWDTSLPTGHGFKSGTADR